MCSCGPTQHYPVYTLQSCTGCRSCHYRVPPPQATAPRAAASAHCSWPQQVGHRVERLAEERKLLVEARVVVVQLERAAELAHEHVHVLMCELGGQPLPGNRPGASGCNYWVGPPAAREGWQPHELAA